MIIHSCIYHSAWGFQRCSFRQSGQCEGLNAQENDSYVKYMFFDLGVMQTMLGIPSAEILLASEVDLVNKGGASEMFAGLEMVKYSDCFQRAEMHYWQNTAKGSSAEVDYLRVRNGVVLPVEVKASKQGAMQSLWVFMRKRKLEKAVRTSLENFGQFEYVDSEAEGAVRHVDIVPLYALSNLRHTAEDFRNMISRETMELEASGEGGA